MLAPPHSVFLNRRSWLLFEKLIAYFHLTRPPRPKLAVAPIVGPELDPVTWSDYEEFVYIGSRIAWLQQLEVVNDSAQRGIKNAQEIAKVTLWLTE